jgi:hypothetical protein
LKNYFNNKIPKNRAKENEIEKLHWFVAADNSVVSQF